MMKIDVVTTSTIRPGLLNKTYRSFFDKIFKDKSRYRLIINIDPVGDKDKKAEDVLNVAKQYFDDVVYNIPDEPGFTKSVMWLWSNTSSDYVFHLEDDWVVNENINIDYMMSILDNYERICSVRLSKGTISAAKKIIYPFKCSYIKEEDKGKFDLFPRLSFNPTLYRGQFVRDAVKVMTLNLNPESQLVHRFAKKKEIKSKTNEYYNSDKIEDLLSKWDHSVLKGHPVIRDIGLNWRQKHGIRRKYDFMYWR